MSRPYTIQDPHHASSRHVAGRKAKCCGCTKDDPTGAVPWLDGEILKGEECIKVRIGVGKGTRTQLFHPACYFGIKEQTIQNMLNSTWQVHPVKELKIVDAPEYSADDELFAEQWARYAENQLQYVEEN